MWLMTTVGFFSVVDKPEDDELTLTIRARVKSDLESLRDLYLPTMGQIQSYVGADYPYRAQAERSELGAALLQIVLDIDYSNFKDEIYKSQGSARARAYGRVWAALYGLEMTTR